MAAIAVIFISVFLILLVTVLYRKYHRKKQQEQIYEYTPPAVVNKYFPSPPPIPPPRISTTDNPAYERIPTMDCVAYASSSSGLTQQDQSPSLKTQSSIVSNV